MTSYLSAHARSTTTTSTYRSQPPGPLGMRRCIESPSRGFLPSFFPVSRHFPRDINARNRIVRQSWSHAGILRESLVPLSRDVAVSCVIYLGRWRHMSQSGWRTSARTIAKRRQVLNGPYLLLFLLRFFTHFFFLFLWRAGTFLILHIFS